MFAGQSKAKKIGALVVTVLVLLFVAAAIRSGSFDEGFDTAESVAASIDDSAVDAFEGDLDSPDVRQGDFTSIVGELSLIHISEPTRPY